MVEQVRAIYEHVMLCGTRCACLCESFALTGPGVPDRGRWDEWSHLVPTILRNGLRGPFVEAERGR